MGTRLRLTPADGHEFGACRGASLRVLLAHGLRSEGVGACRSGGVSASLEPVDI